MMMEEGQERVRASYRDNYDRLAVDQGRLRPDQPVPHQPEHPACAVTEAHRASASSKPPCEPPTHRTSLSAYPSPLATSFQPGGPRGPPTQ